jgi:hypothetical protein
VNLRTFLFRVCFFLITMLVVSEVFFRVVLPAREYPMTVMDPDTGIRHYQPSTEGTFTYGALCRGGYSWRINPQGWNSSYDYRDDSSRDNPMVALIGDSYLEGFWSDLDEHLDVILHERSHGEIDFYTFGTWGAMLSQYLVIARYAVSEFGADEIVIFLNEGDAGTSLDTGSARVNLCYTIEPLEDGSFRMVPPPGFSTGRIIPLLLESATIRYLKTNRNLPFLARGAVADVNANVSEAQSASSPDGPVDPGVVAATGYMLDGLESLGVPVILVADGPRAPVYRGESDPPRFRDCALIGDLCRGRDGIVFVDLVPFFVEDWREHGIEFSPADNPHWDAYGNGVVADAIWADVIRAL